VLTTEPLGKTLDYLAPAGGCALGAFVEVPLGPRRVLGVVWGQAGAFPAREAARHGAGARRRADAGGDARVPPARGGLHADADAGDAAACDAVAGLGDPPSMRTVYRMGDRAPDRMTEAREKVLAVLEDFGDAAFTLGELAEMAGVSTGW
jgi:primosomal protein N' (replication factor Y) (superfamily II helicase)